MKRGILLLVAVFSSAVAGDLLFRPAATGALLRELEDGRHGAVTLVAAGERSQVLGEGSVLATGVGVTVSPNAWSCGGRARPPRSSSRRSPWLPSSAARILVLSDQAPPSPLSPGRLSWWAFGRDASNLALVSAMRAPEGRGETADGCLVEVANYSSRAVVARLDATVGEQAPAPLARLELATSERAIFVQDGTGRSNCR